MLFVCFALACLLIENSPYEARSLNSFKLVLYMCLYMRVCVSRICLSVCPFVSLCMFVWLELSIHPKLSEHADSVNESQITFSFNLLFLVLPTG